jgi:hypothetical protein
MGEQSISKERDQSNRLAGTDVPDHVVTLYVDRIGQTAAAHQSSDESLVDFVANSFTHEEGHALGLCHNQLDCNEDKTDRDSDDLMYPEAGINDDEKEFTKIDSASINGEAAREAE